MQPVVLDPHGTARFQENKLVCFLLNWSSGRGMSLNDLALLPFDADDRSQLAQLIGYSVSGYGDLSYAQDVAKADDEVKTLLRLSGRG